MVDQHKVGRPAINHEVRSSAHAFLVPNVLATVNLLDYAPGGEAMRAPRSFTVLGDLELDGSDVPIPGALVVQLIDATTLVLPINAGSIGLPFDVQAWKFLTSGIGRVISQTASPTAPAVTFEGTPAATAQIIVEVTTTGILGAGQYRYSLDGGATYSAAANLPADGTDVLGASGITANFAAGTYTDGDFYMANVGVTDVRDILVTW